MRAFFGFCCVMISLREEKLKVKSVMDCHKIKKAMLQNVTFNMGMFFDVLMKDEELTDILR